MPLLGVGNIQPTKSMLGYFADPLCTTLLYLMDNLHQVVIYKNTYQRLSLKSDVYL